MSDIRTNGWIRIEGCQISDLYRQYGTLTGIPSSEQHVYYGTPEIQINNPYSDTHSVIYCIKYIAPNFGYTQIHDIDENWSTFASNIQSWMENNDIDDSDPNTAYYYVGKPFVIDKSCVIYYDDSSKASITGSKYTNYAIVLIDEYAQPSIISITAKYNGDSIPIGEAISTDDIEIVAAYDDGNTIKVKSNYRIEPANRIVTKLGANLFTVYYIDQENDVNTATFLVQGIKNLQVITGKYDGDAIAYNNEAEKKYFVITAHYSDDTEAIVTDFTFPNGNVVTEQNTGLIDVYYKGRTCQVQVPIYQIKQSRLIAYYNGPKVEVSQDFLTQYLSIKIYYASEDNEHSYYENVSVENCIINNTKVTKEGANTFSISYEGQLGVISTAFTVIGFYPEVKPVSIQATYNGPNIYQGDSIDLERILCNIYYSNGTIKTTKNFNVSTNIISSVGVNEITVTYIEDSVILSDIISINGIEKDNTTTNNIFPTNLTNHYPTATILNNRYRGPAEAVKTTEYANMICKNIYDLYNLFASLEKQYNKVASDITNDNSIKIMTLNDVTYMNQQIYNILNDNHYSTGVYKSEDISE